MTEEIPKSSNELAQDRTDLAEQRTVLAADRTLMAWVRTTISLVTFGFTIYKFLQYTYERSAVKVTRASGPRHLGLFLIAMGTAPLVLVIIRHWRFLRQLGKKPRQILLDPTFMIACAINALGLFLFVSILTRVELF